MSERGLVSPDNLAIIEREQWSYISCLDKDEVGNLEFFKRGIAADDGGTQTQVVLYGE